VAAQERRAIAVFAHNEAIRITGCLRSVEKAVRHGDQCVVLNNGSTDNTQSLVEEFCKANAFCTLVTIDVGDKANAWNVFVHELGIEADLFCFLDGDCEIAPNSLDALQKCIASNPLANAATALPPARLWQRTRQAILRDGGLAGNLYALSKQFVERLRGRNVRLPFGLIGDDSLVGALAYWDLNPTEDWDERRIVVCADAEFSFVSLWPFSPRGLQLSYRRRIRYSLRHFQTVLMRKPLKQRGLAGIPKSVDDLYASHFREVGVAWRGVDTLFDYIAARRIGKCVAQRLRGHA
jgi:glycosyltransferase involved in cell wall biosynthesis